MLWSGSDNTYQFDWIYSTPNVTGETTHHIDGIGDNSIS